MKKMPARLFKILAVCLALLLLTGCWDNHELDTLSIVTGIGVDKAEDPDQIDLSLQVGTVEKSSGQEKASSDQAFTILESKNEYIISSIESLISENSRTIYLHHNQMIVFGSELAKEGIKPYLDAFMRNIQTRLEVWVYVAEEDAKSVLSAQPEQDKISAMALTRMTLNETNISELLGVNLLSLTSRLADKTTDPVIPTVKVIEENGKKNLSLSGMAVFRDDVLVGHLDNTLTLGYILASGKVKEEDFNVSLEQGGATIQIIKSQCKTSIALEKDGSVTVSLKIESKVTANELHGFKNMTVEQVSPLLQKAAAEEINKLIGMCFEKTQELNTDIYGIGAAVHRKYPKQWKTMENKWDQIYPKTKLSTDVEVILTGTGRISESLAMKENQQ